MLQKLHAAANDAVARLCDERGWDHERSSVRVEGSCVCEDRPPPQVVRQVACVVFAPGTQGYRRLHVTAPLVAAVSLAELTQMLYSTIWHDWAPAYAPQVGGVTSVGSSTPATEEGR